MKQMQAITYTLTVTSQQSGALIGQDLFRASLRVSDEVLWWLTFGSFWLSVLALALDAGLARTWRGLVGGWRWVRESLGGAWELSQEVGRCFAAKQK